MPREIVVVTCRRREAKNSSARLNFMIAIEIEKRQGQQHVLYEIIARPASIPATVAPSPNGFSYTDKDGYLKYLDIVVLTKPKYVKTSIVGRREPVRPP